MRMRQEMCAGHSAGAETETIPGIEAHVDTRKAPIREADVVAQLDAHAQQVMGRIVRSPPLVTA